MNLRQLLLKNNACYISGEKHQVRGIMVHSTGANNPNLRRFIGPDDGLLGPASPYHWNQSEPDGALVCVHGFIGKLYDGSIATYQTLPWDMVGWHSGSGYLGYEENANNTGYIGFEICEDDLTNGDYFNKVYREAVELCAFLCDKFSIKPEKPYLICHSEGHTLGIASNHADVMHWFPRHGKSMDTFRKDVKAQMLKNKQPKPEPVVIDNTPDPYATEDIAWALKNNILKGDEKGNLKLHSNITRQDCLVFIHRAINQLK